MQLQCAQITELSFCTAIRGLSLLWLRFSECITAAIKIVAQEYAT